MKRFQVRISNILRITYFQTVDEMRAALDDYLKVCNPRIVQLVDLKTAGWEPKVYKSADCAARFGTFDAGAKNGTMAEGKPELFVQTADNHVGLNR